MKLRLQVMHKTENALLLSDGDSEEWIPRERAWSEAETLMKGRVYSFEISEKDATERGWN